MRAPERSEADLLSRLYYSMRRIRAVEEAVERVYPLDKIQSPVHLSIGQEAIASGVCEALEESDVCYGTYRGHAMYLAKGGDLPRMVAELYARRTGCAQGKGGSMHLIDVAHGVMGTSAVVGTTIPLAAGHALAMQLRGEPSVVVCFFGDGATEEGVYYETLNFAALRRLPLLFVCENNGLAIHSPLASRQAGTAGLAAKAGAHGLPTAVVATGDVLAIHETAATMVSEIRAGAGPQFLECRAYRWRRHVGPGEDYEYGYRERQEGAEWMLADQIPRLGALLDPGERQALDRRVDAEVTAAFDFAEASPFPDPGRDLYTDAVR